MQASKILDPFFSFSLAFLGRFPTINSELAILIHLFLLQPLSLRLKKILDKYSYI